MHVFVVYSKGRGCGERVQAREPRPQHFPGLSHGAVRRNVKPQSACADGLAVSGKRAYRDMHTAIVQGKITRVNARLVGTVLAAALLLIPAPPARAELISTAQEIAIGRRAAAQLEAEFGVVADPARREAVTKIGTQLAAISERPQLPWTFRVLNTTQVNAISLPGGFVYVTRGMMSFVQSTDELAFVLAHEVGHVERRHHVALIQRDFLFTIVVSLVLGRDPGTAQIGDLVGALLQRGFSREAEFEADAAGVTLAHRAGFNAASGLAFMERLRVAEGRDPSQVEVLFRTHPALADRIVRVRTLLRHLGYRVAVQSPAA
jgi:predicted Zn-dependent protease